MSYFLPHLPSGWHVDEAIKSEEDRVVVIRFGHDWDSQCMTMDETLYSVAEKVQNFAVIYLVDITAVPDFNKVRCAFLQRHHLIARPRCTSCTTRVPSCSFTGARLFAPICRDLLIAGRNKHIMIDLGTGNNNKMWVCHPSLVSASHRPSSNWAMDNKQEVSIPARPDAPAHSR